MISPNANLFKALRDQVAALADGDGNKYFPFVDQELGQLEAHDGSNRPPVKWPCVLIDIDSTNYQDLSHNVQTGICYVVFRIGFPPISSSSNITPSTYSDKSIYYYELEQILHLALQGSVPSLIVDEVDVLAPICGHLSRISAKTEQRTDFIRVREVRYSLGIQDFSTKPSKTLIPAALDLGLGFSFPDE